MADDIKIKLGLDASELFAGLNKVTAEANKAIAGINNAKLDINEAPLIADLNKVEKEAKQTGDVLDKEVGGGLSGLKDKFGGLTGGIDNLGGSFQSLTSGVTSLVPGLGSLSGILAGGGITAGIAALGAGIAYSIDKGKEFETQLASLSSITGVSGDGLADLGDKAKVMAAKFGTDATANIESFKTILSKLGPDIAKSPEALNSMAESVNTLSKATGDDPGKATEALTGALLQFGVSLDDPVKAADAMAVAMNVLAAGAKEGASEVPDVAAAINVAGVAASSAKVSFEETNSAIQILAAGGKVGAEAGTSLRNVLNKLGEGRFLPKDAGDELKKAGVDINKLGDTSISLSERLRELNKISGDAALKTKLFGTDAAAASILIKGANGNMDELTKKITATNTAYDQAAINMATFDEQLSRIKSNIDNFAISFYDGMKMSFGMLAESIGPSVNELMATMSEYFNRMWSVVQPILAALGAILMGTISNTITVVIETLNLFYETAVYAFDQVVGALKPLYDAIMSALGLDGAMGQGIDVVKMLQDAMNFMSAAISAIFDVLQALGKILIDVVVFAFSKVISIITTVIETVAAVGRAIFDFVKGIPGVQSAIDGLSGAFKSVYDFFNGLPSIINESQAYLKAIGATFQSVFNIIGEAFTAALNLDFGGAADKLASVFESQTWVNAFSTNLTKARAEVKKTADEVKKAGQEFKNFQGDAGAATTPPPGATDKKKGEKAKEADSEYKLAVEAYKDYLDEIETKRKEAIRDWEDKGYNKEQIQLKLQEDPNLAPTSEAVREKISQLFKTTYDENGKLQIGVKLGSKEDREDSLREVRKIIADSDKFEVKLKVKTDLSWRESMIKELAEYSKEVQENSKDYAKVAGELFKKAVNTQPLLDKAEKDFDNITAILAEQQVELTNQINLALSIGDQKAAESLQKIKDNNAEIIKETELRYFRFVADSKKAIDKNTIYLQISNALQTSLLDEFNAEKIKKEKETNDKIRDEKLAALDQEDKDLTAALAKREITFEEYSLKVAEISKARDAANQEANKTFLDRLKTAGDKTAASVLKSQGEVFTENAKNMQGNQKIFNEAIGQTLTSFSTLAESGKATLADFGKAAAGAAFDAVSKMIPAFVAGILGSSITQLGPIAGPLAAATLTASLQLLLSTARSALGFKDGVVGLEGAGTETSDSIPAWLSRGESVITAAGTRANREELAWMNENPGLSIRDYFADRVPIKHYSVGSDGDLIHEVRKLREETRGLGKQITRKTIVEVSGELSADSKSIKAVIEADRRRASRRGL